MAVHADGKPGKSLLPFSGCLCCPLHPPSLTVAVPLHRPSGALPRSRLWAQCPGTFGCVGSRSHPSGSHPASPELPVLV